MLPVTELLLTEQELDSYRTEGFLLREHAIPEDRVKGIREEIDRLSTVDVPSRVFEADGRTIRALHGNHRDSALFSDLVRDDLFLGTALQLLGGNVYVYQFKINLKAAFSGDIWKWHEDFVFWEQEDGMPKPLAVNVALFVDEVNEFNGPLFFVPGSHRRLSISSEHVDHDGDVSSTWGEDVSAALKYTVGRAELQSLVAEAGIVAPKASAGAVLVFHPRIVHGSSPNMSPFDRRLLMATYNRCDNVPLHADRRPEFLVSRDNSPLRPLSGSVAETLLVGDFSG